MFVFLLLLRPPVFRLNEDAILHIFLYLSAKDRIRIERGKYKSHSYTYYGKTVSHFLYVRLVVLCLCWSWSFWLGQVIKSFIKFRVFKKDFWYQLEDNNFNFLKNSIWFISDIYHNLFCHIIVCRKWRVLAIKSWRHTIHLDFQGAFASFRGVGGDFYLLCFISFLFCHQG